MEIIAVAREMQRRSDLKRMKGKRIAFVPTMGYLHEGHLNLMREGRSISDDLVVSIFVNPTQFGPNEDLAKYPRDFERDRRLCESVGVDVIFTPSPEEMYPLLFQTYVSVEGVTKNLCGLSRPGHFRGVATVCAKLFNIVKPHAAVFGKKDFQQFVTIRRMAEDLNLDVEIVGMTTTREPDGLAMSSRNTYLKTEERKSALSLYRSLLLAQDLYDKGERRAAVIIDRVAAFIESHPATAIDYVKICDAAAMEDIEFIDGDGVIALAVKVGATRLIDNHVFGETLPAYGS
ncbi:MAG: pantoate--beta-alanine ligase [Deltaproteobacteria bacterium]|nr:pantoate--beta-alanine ligase [Deltaproteobacteria bacterium]